MALDAVRSTLTIASMIGAAAKERAGELAGGVLEIPGVGPSAAKALELGGQASALAEEVATLLSTNRGAITDVLRAEIGLQLQRVGLSTPDMEQSSRAEIDRLKAEVADLRRALEAASAMAARSSAAATGRPGGPRTAAGTAATANPTTGRTAPRATATKVTAKRTAAKRTAAKRTVVKKAAVKKAAVAKPATTKATVKKSAPRTSAGETTHVRPAVADNPRSGGPVHTTDSNFAPSSQPTTSVRSSREGTDTSYSDLERDA